jgi:hypothetical protein
MKKINFSTYIKSLDLIQWLLGKEIKWIEDMTEEDWRRALIINTLNLKDWPLILNNNSWVGEEEIEADFKRIRSQLIARHDDIVEVEIMSCYDVEKGTNQNYYILKLPEARILLSGRAFELDLLNWCKCTYESTVEYQEQ